ncbi:MAG TPA: LamG-like jellyroll fold domain-containing protein [Planctomycetota bacterium]|nr:LamG-like jellyroll fold domain-containing protein [Planctomycetota bacterium]
MDRRGDRTKLRRSGVTLLEILVVLAILSMIFAMTIGVLRNANRDLGVMAAANTVTALLRAAGEHARAENSPAWVVLNTNERTAGTLIRESIVMCHFEDTSGGFNKTIDVHGAVQVLGRVGLAYRFKGSDTIDCGDIPRFAADQGISIEMWFNRNPGQGKHILASIGKEMEVSVDAVGRVQARVGNVTADSGTNLIPREWWVYCQAIYNGREIKILLNGAEAGSKPCRHQWRGSAPLVLGAKKDGLAGLMDEVRVSAIIPHDTYQLPPQVEFELPRSAKLQDGEYLIAFDGTGRLDATRHTGEVTITLKSPAASKTLVITRQGQVRR